MLMEKNKRTATKEAMRKLEKLAMVQGHQKMDGPEWACAYISLNGNMGDMAIAVTPPITDVSSLSKH